MSKKIKGRRWLTISKAFGEIEGQPWSYPGFESFSFILARADGGWRVFEQTSGHGISWNMKTRKAAIEAATENLLKSSIDDMKDRIRKGLAFNAGERPA